MIAREQTTVRNQWKKKRDQIAWEIWVEYRDKYNKEDIMESSLEED